MAIAIFGDRISFDLASLRARTSGGAAGGSALQNSDINRAELGALLRRHDKDVSQHGGRNFWAGFMAAQAASCANSNG